MPLVPHHDSSPLHVSTQHPALGDEVHVRLRVPDGYGPAERANRSGKIW